MMNNIKMLGCQTFAGEEVDAGLPEVVVKLCRAATVAEPARAQPVREFVVNEPDRRHRMRGNVILYFLPRIAAGDDAKIMVFRQRLYAVPTDTLL